MPGILKGCRPVGVLEVCSVLVLSIYDTQMKSRVKASNNILNVMVRTNMLNICSNHDVYMTPSHLFKFRCAMKTKLG